MSLAAPSVDRPAPAASHDARRLAETIFADIVAMSPDKAGVSRPAFGDVESATLDYLETTAREHGLSTWRDGGDNLMIAGAGDRDPSRAAVVIGSHVDSVPQGGNFDGLAGVVAGLLVLLALEEEGFSGAVPLRVLALRGEESAWYGQAYMGSQALLGRLKPKALATRRRDGETTLGEALAALGVDVAKVERGEPLIDPATIAAFLELHIEQGPLLVDRGWPMAAVTGIRGNIRHREIRCIGEAGHSGAVPRWLRHDAVFAVCELIVRLDEHWATIQQHGGDLVLTAGIFQTDAAKHAMSRVPGEASFSFEARSQDPATLSAMEHLLHSECATIERERGVRFEFDDLVRSEPARLDAQMIAAIMEEADAAGLPKEQVPSGAGHDAAVFAQAGIPAGMVFVRNRNGSHNPNEAMEIDDLLAAVTVMRGVARRLVSDPPKGTAQAT